MAKVCSKQKCVEMRRNSQLARKPLRMFYSVYVLYLVSTYCYAEMENDRDREREDHAFPPSNLLIDTRAHDLIRNLSKK